MSNELKATGTLIGGNNFSAFEIDNLFYRASEIKVKQKIIFPSLGTNQAYKVSLEDKLKYPFLVSGIEADLMADDSTTNDFMNIYAIGNVTINLWVRTINKRTNKVIDETFYQLNPHFELKQELILYPDRVYEFLTDQDVNGFTFIGEPVYMLDPIVITDNVTRVSSPNS